MNKEEKSKIQVEKWREEKKVVPKKKVESSIDKDTVTDNTHNTHNTHNTNTIENLPLLSVLCDNTIPKTLFGEETFERILHIFATSSEYFTYDKIAEIMHKKQDNIRQAILRKKEYFVSHKPDGKKKLSQLSQIARDEIQKRIDDYKQNLVRIKENKQRKIEKQNLQKDYEIEVIDFITHYKPKRDGQIIFFNFRELSEHNLELADSFLKEPNKFIDILLNHFGKEFSIEVLNFPNLNNVSIENIRKNHLNKIICIEGRVTSFGNVRPIIYKTKYECPSCGDILSIEQNYIDQNLREPFRCSCGRKGGFKLIEKETFDACFVQLEDLQEKTDNPHSQRVKAILKENLTTSNKIRTFTPGNEVKCIGVLKEVPVIKGNKKTVYINWILEVLNAELIEKDIEIENLSEEDKKQINEISNKIDREGINSIVNSFAPDIYGYEEIKSAIIFQLCNKRNSKEKNNVRNKSNVLLIGDPGVAKSIIGDFAIDVSAGSRKAVGGGSSAVGITASVVKEEESLGGFRVEPGAMILAKDLLFLDELNNLSDEDKPKLQEGMSEQQVTINKANLHVQMKVSCGILAVANPIHGYFQNDKNVAEQFNIPTPILNRFDSVFVVRDNVNEEKDGLIADKMLDRHRGILEQEYSKELLKKFFAYIRQIKEPEMTNEVSEYIKEIYKESRKTYNSNVKINPRFLESLTRMSVSCAKLRQSKSIEIKDINFAFLVLSKSQYNVSPSVIKNKEGFEWGSEEWNLKYNKNE